MPKQWSHVVDLLGFYTESCHVVFLSFLKIGKLAGYIKKT